MKWFGKRLQEPSSHAGLGLVGLGTTEIANGNWQGGIAPILFGLLAFWKGEEAFKTLGR